MVKRITLKRGTSKARTGNVGNKNPVAFS